MYVKNIIENKFTILSTAALILVPYYTWRKLYRSYKSFKMKYEEEQLFQKRHNCVVMYSQIKGMSGWPPYTERIRLNIDKEICLTVLQEPIIYFINTAKKSLDVACMIIGISAVYKALIEAHKRGVKVRLLLNFEHSDGKHKEIKGLLKAGIEVSTYVSQDMISIMHLKYMIKDYTKTSGFMFTGSLNMTDSGYLNNYEDIVFTSNHYVVSTFHKNFDNCWKFVEIENEDIINQTVLLDANLI